MSLFGWSLPPGVGRLPGEEEGVCEICEKCADDCVCPECPVCGTAGDLGCYGFTGHGLELSPEQIAAMEAAAKAGDDLGDDPMGDWHGRNE